MCWTENHSQEDQSHENGTQLSCRNNFHCLSANPSAGWVNWSKILHFKRQLHVLRFLEPLKNQIVLSNLNHASSSPSPQTHAVHYISAEIHCSLVQQSLWSPWELICTPASEGVSPASLQATVKQKFIPEAAGASLGILFTEYREISRIHPRAEGCIPRLSLGLRCCWVWVGM